MALVTTGNCAAGTMSPAKGSFSKDRKHNQATRLKNKNSKLGKMRWQGKTSEEELSEVEVGNLLWKWFWVMIIKIIKELGRRMDAQREMLEIFSKESENTQNNQTDMKNTRTEMKNKPE